MKVDTKRGLIVVFMVQHANDWDLEGRQRLMDALEQTAVPAGGGPIAALLPQLLSPHGVPTSSKSAPTNKKELTKMSRAIWAMFRQTPAPRQIFPRR